MLIKTMIYISALSGIYGCGILEPKQRVYAEPDFNLAGCVKGQEYYSRLASPVHSNCLECHNSSSELPLYDLSSSANIAKNRKALFESRGWDFASTKEHPGYRFFIQMFPNIFSYDSFIEVEKSCR